MKKVLITFATDYYPSNTGFAQAFMHLHNSIIENKVCEHVHVFTTGESQTPNIDKITVHSIPNVRGIGYLIHKSTRRIVYAYIKKRYASVFNVMQSICAENNVQMILIESMFLAWLIPLFKEEFKDIPIVCRIHGTGPEYTAFYKEIEDIKFREYLLECVFKSDNIAATTKYYFDFFRDYYKSYAKFMDKEFFLLPNTTIFESTKEGNQEKKYIELLQLGRMDMRGYHQKGFADTVKALMYIENSNPKLASTIKYTTIGCGNKEKEFLSRTAKFKYICHEHYDKLPNDEVKEKEMASDIILLPSRCEGMSMFATEAIAAGKPLVCTGGNGLESVCVDGYNGYFVSEYDYVRMAEAIERLVEDDALRIKFAKNSIQLYNQTCSYDAVAKKYELMVRYLDNEEK